MRNIADMICASAEKSGGNIAFSYLDKTMTWYEVFKRAFFVKERLMQNGIKRGDVVAILADHSPAQVISLFAISMADAIFIIVNQKLKSNQIFHQLIDANAKLVIGKQELLIDISEFLIENNISKEFINAYGLLDNMSTGQIPNYDIDQMSNASIPSDISNIIYTSGSTGKPKGVVIPHRTLLDGARIVSTYLNITGNDVTLSILPLTFDYGLNQILTATLKGSKIVFHNFTFPMELINTLINEKITGMAAVPSLWPHILNPRFIDVVKKHKFSALRYITTAGGPHKMSLLKELDDYFPNTEIIIMYGLTESFRSTYLPYSELFKRPNSIGRAVPEVEILVYDENGQNCTSGVKGELVHRGAFVSYGYLNNPELNKEKFIKLKSPHRCISEIGVRSGDIVSKDKEGFIYFHGRLDSQIKCSGYRVSPDDVNDIALSYPDIFHCAVFGLQDSLLGESVNLAYDTLSRKPLDEVEFIKYLKELLPSYACPKSIKFYDAIPLTAHGKIDYTFLKQNQIQEIDEYPL